MAPPSQPPRQEGKFKPRKPPKRAVIRPGASVGAPIVPPPAPSSGGRGGRGGRGREGGRGRGRGRGRFIVQQGPSFFTANRPAQAAAASRSGSTSGGASGSGGTRSSAAGSSNNPLSSRVQSRLQAAATAGASLMGRGATMEPEEEILEILEDGIGGNDGPEKVKSSSSSKKRATAKETKSQTEEPVEELPPSVFEYDSDSSIEVDRPNHKAYLAGVVMPKKHPLTLPFPAAKFPPGVGAPIHLETMPRRKQSTDDSLATSAVSPFVSLADIQDLQAERGAWFLLQLPTRLPALDGATPRDNDEVVVVTNEVDPMALSDVATVPLRKDCFDNSLVRANPGKIGKFVVYESGKTVLVLEGEDGRPYSLNVTEGLSCSFRQQAVVIDDAKKEFIPLGDVGKTVVVTPDIETAFRDFQ